ncbi:MAG TPA: phosphomethylpyrimidine synthase ThiC [Hungateiclostridium thermocellum]|jgi:phosphomethylpyrimidine synthase|uniref:Phosphomethylpyrimidine synthase n=2 Tax=Acetivibrio thermocellus TaxID=1515 RepID=A3DD08_ACET2|nr:phosphomethylpyrimidine synthase ThiC [Acetivibrio thermocellus]CDG35292.1 Phosphomethylpyrimidine synthase [Acetivibrio thermocellus BC1]ABN51837.1 thiamine biosynthesis protein ThiC [Acetivibrio thermocellus ATCC 27405]ADU74688.1 thiamine biosynthesis protein ThiC [Acetivibrio thermocellus DSM 1313]ALX08631.1 Phosphomethylpyrimidine synthase [Acetivibrio thermocellus AD2]ANV76380.1 Phosphomethylpyrimidine synthase [Acetivibrio thermocellus DSM 2360]
MYTTQMDAAKKGIITDEMRIVAEKEGVHVEKLRELVASGKVVIPANKNHKKLEPQGIGEGLRTKINVNIGISKDCCNFEMELEKAKKAIELKAEAIMDLSSYGKTREFRRKLVEMSPVMIGTVPVYDAVGFYEKDLKDISAEEFFEVVEKHAEDGVDFMTIHAGINRETAKRFKENGRLTNIVSRGGSLIFAWMELTGNENPFYEQYDRLLQIFEKYDVTISLGDALRPGSINDSTDASQIQELIVLGELTKRAWEKNVQVMIEGPGHMAINEIAPNMVLEKKLCHGAPFYVLGPIVTDIAPGYDHITSAIGGAIAAANGADFLCYVTPAEHLRLPDIDDMKEGIIAARIAAHAADIAKGIKGAREWDYQMSEARRNLDWNRMFELAIDREKAERYRKSSMPEDEDTCTMCGRMCAVKNTNKALKGEKINIL